MRGSMIVARRRPASRERAEPANQLPAFAAAADPFELGLLAPGVRQRGGWRELDGPFGPCARKRSIAAGPGSCSSTRMVRRALGAAIGIDMPGREPANVKRFDFSCNKHDRRLRHDGTPLAAANRATAGSRSTPVTGPPGQAPADRRRSRSRDPQRALRPGSGWLCTRQPTGRLPAPRPRA